MSYDPADAYDEMCHHDALEAKWVASVIRAAIEEDAWEIVDGPTVDTDGWRTVTIAFPETQLEKDYESYVEQQGKECLAMQREEQRLINKGLIE